MLLDAGRPMDLQGFSLGDMLRCGLDVRRVAAGAGSLEEAAARIVRYLHDTLRDTDADAPACALVRFFVTRPFATLPAELQAAARTQAGGAVVGRHTRCLTLLATAGGEAKWNDRRASRGHRAIPLLSAEMVERAPMISQMLRQFGLDLGQVLAPSTAAGDTGERGRTYDIFYVPEAAGSPHIPAQAEFVAPHGIRSVVAFGGMLRDEVFACILFCRVPVPEAAATRFRNVALDVKLALLHHGGDRVFADDPE